MSLFLFFYFILILFKNNPVPAEKMVLLFEFLQPKSLLVRTEASLYLLTHALLSY